MPDIFVCDTLGRTTRVSATSSTEANGDSADPSISGDARSVAFETLSDNLVAGDTNGALDVYPASMEASLAWLGTTGYETDGVDPDSGTPRTDPSASTFTFKVLYTDRSGDPPRSAHCMIQKRTFGEWEPHREIGMRKESGDVAFGAVYACSTELPSAVFQYRFVFTNSDGQEVGGEPASFHEGPRLTGFPRLAWTGAAGFRMDGVDPNYGPLDTQFRFQVEYMSPSGEVPSLHELRVRRDGRLWKTKEMAAAASGSDHSGRIYRTSVRLNQPGRYEYRFAFQDSNEMAHGWPCNWHPGPRITSDSPAAIASLTTLPTAAGAQITFTLSAPAQVEARVLNIAGRPVATICHARECEAGTNTLLWNARSDQGLPVPDGMYLVAVVADAADGSQARGLGQVRIGR